MSAKHNKLSVTTVILSFKKLGLQKGKKNNGASNNIKLFGKNSAISQIQSYLLSGGAVG
jgi:hypothetical protein